MKISRLFLCLLSLVVSALPGWAQTPAKTNPEILNRLKDPAAASGIPTDASIAPASGGGTTKSNQIPGGFNIIASGIGYSFTSGTSDFDYGEEITPPLVDLDGNLMSRSEAEAYWRAEPVRPGEVVQTVEDIGLVPVPADFGERYYYSPHAERLIASQTGSISLKWMTAEPDIDGNFRVSPEFTFYTIGFGTDLTTRTVYWTEQDYNAPRVQIPGGIVQDLEIVYNDRFRETVPDEQKIIPSGAQASLVENLTLQFDRTLGVLKAYNLEGRVIVEYLGAPRGEAGDEIRVSLGFEIIQVRKALNPVVVRSIIGEQLLPSDSPGNILDELDFTPIQVSDPGPPVAQHFIDNHVVYYGIGENFEPANVEFFWMEEGEHTIEWPLLRNTYRLDWPDEIGDFEAVFARPTGGAQEVIDESVLNLISTNSPELLFQDDPLGGEANLDFEFKFSVSIDESVDPVNRSLIRFNSGNQFWYIRLYSATTEELRRIDPTGNAFDPANDFDFYGAENVVVGQRLEPPNANLLPGGYIDPASGDAYLPEAYVSPFEEGGIAAAGEAAIIPINALPGNNILRVWWSRLLSPPADKADLFQAIFVPTVLADYTISYPIDAPRIVMASNAGTGALSPEQATGEIYVQNDPGQPGYNPNEEHALMISGRAYALRDDLNVTDVSSEPFVLISYDHADGRPAVAVFEVFRELTMAEEPTLENDLVFDYSAVAGTLLQAPFPLPIIPQPLADGVSLNTEVTPDNLNPVANGPAIENLTHYDQFTFQDRKGATWVYRGPHEPEVASGFKLSMQYYYPTLETFAFPNAATGVDEAPALGTNVPYLRPLDGGGNPLGDPVEGTPLTITFTPVWPEQTPILHFGETLAKAKFGLPQILGQKSAEIVYQQSIARDYSVAQNSVVLHDSTINRSSDLADAGLTKLPATVLTTSSRGKVYFQGLPSHLEDRLYFDSLAGTQGRLIFQGRFNDEPVGEDYLQPNTLSGDDVALIKELCLATDEDRAKWETLIDNLQVVPLFRVLDERNVEEQLPYDEWLSHAGLDDFIGQNGPGDDLLYGPTDLPELLSPDQVVNEYFLSAIGGGDGYVTLVTGNGLVNSEVGDPIQMHVFRVGEKIYRGELKPLVAANPLSERVTVLHTGDFAGDPGSYEFEWKKAPPVNGLAPPVFLFQNLTLPGSLTNPALSRNISTVVGEASWGAGSPTSLPFDEPIYRAGDDRTVPGLRLSGSLDFSPQLAGDDRLNKVYFSLKLRDGDGVIVNLNGVEVLQYGLPGGLDSELAPGIPSDLQAFLTNGDDFLVFELPVRAFLEGANEVEVLYSTDRPDGSSALFDFRVGLQIKEDHSSNYFHVSTSLGKNLHVISGSGIETLGDNYFIMRYRPMDADHPLDQVWSDWTQPALVEGWIKRVLAGINPFNQRISDFFENAVNTNVSIVSQAGARWEGDIALNLDAVQNLGLIEIYETVLKRGIGLSINGTPALDYAPANDALLLAAGYLNDLYVALGNEAFADAANPTVTFDSQALGTLGAETPTAGFEENFRNTATSRFAFQGQVANLLDEELALLRGRDDSLSPSIQTPPVYNRMFWNYTRGIDAGELIYALNYNIREANDGVADGKVDAEDAARMFPQAHGDAYGHYLTAVKNYYRLLVDPEFTWAPRIEAVNVLGQPVSIDYFDERKFASSSAALARTANQVVGLERRKAFQDSVEGWENLVDGRENARTGTTRYWGVDYWASRGFQGAYFNWIVGNAILPEEDLVNEGIQKIDRSTVPELEAIASSAASIQKQLESADASVNPLGLSSDSLLIDISPTELSDGKTHFEQIHERAVGALTNADAIFERAASSTRLLRSLENQSQNLTQVVDDEETAFRAELIEIFGQPYAGDIGPGKLYSQGYDGPDLIRYMAIDRPFEIFTRESLFKYPEEGEKEFSVLVRNQGLLDSFEGAIDSSLNAPFFFAGIRDTVDEAATVTYTMQEDRGPYQIADPSLGARGSVGRLQVALAEARLAEEQLYIGLRAMENSRGGLLRKLKQFELNMTNRTARLTAQKTFSAVKTFYKEILVAIEAIEKAQKLTARTLQQITGAAVESLPVVVGVSNDVSAPARAAILAAEIASKAPLTAAEVGSAQAKAVNDFGFIIAEKVVETAVFLLDQDDYLRGQALSLRSAYQSARSKFREVDALSIAYHRAVERYRTELTNGQRVLTDREVFRRRAAAAVQGYRTRDVAFRTFRSEALEEYQTLLDWASRYAFLAAQAYDYETGLLGSSDGQAFLGKIVSARALGTLDENGQPMIAASASGDPGLSGLLAKLKGDYDVVKGRLGFNNPETNGTTLSLRREYFRIPDGPEGDIAWQQVLEGLVTANLLNDADIASHAMQMGGGEASSQSGILISFPSTIEAGKNFFGKALAPGDSDFSTTSFATKVHSLGVVFEGYQGMSPCVICADGGGDPTHNHDNALSATPNVFLIPTGLDTMRTPPLGESQDIRTWSVQDYAMPLPFDLGALEPNSENVRQTSDNLLTNFRQPRLHPSFRATDRVEFFYTDFSDDYTSSRLVGRSVWNSNWKLAIPARELLANEQEGLGRFIRSVKDIKLHLKTYSYSGN